MTDDEELQEQIDCLEKGAKVMKANLARGAKDLEAIRAELHALIQEQQRRCKHPDGFRGFLIGVCPDCGADDY